MADATLRIRIGVAVEADMSTVFSPLEAAAVKSRARIKKTMSGLGKDIGREMAKGDGEVDYRTSARKAEQSADARVKAEQKASDKIVALKEREAKKNEQIERRKNDAASRRDQRIADASALRMSGGAVRDFGRGLVTAKGMAGDLARGAGVKMDLTGQVAQNVNLEARASKLSNASWDMRGGKAQATGADIMGDVRTVASATGSDMGDVLGAMEAFVGKTGDLKTARDMLMSMARISKATGASLEDMLNSSGDIAMQLGAGADKGAVLAQVAKIMAGQGQVGAVEYKDIADGIAVIAAKQGKFKLNADTKNLFAGAGVTDDVAANVGVMGVLTQAVRQSGGKPSARQSLSASQAFIRDLTGGAGLKRMGEMGIDPFADKEHTMLRDPKELILEMLKKTGGDQKKLTRLLPNQNSRAVVDAFSGTFTQGMDAAKKGGAKKPEEIQKAGLDAVAKRFDELAKSNMSDAEVSQKFDVAMQTTESKVNSFNVELSKLTSAAGTKMIPALEKLGPSVLRAVDGFTRLAGYAVDNPFKAVISLLGLSILKSMGGEVLRASIERGITGAFAAKLGPMGAANTMIGGGGAVPSAAGPGLGVMGNALAAVAIASIAVATMEVGKAIISDVIDKKVKRDDDARNRAVEIGNAVGTAKDKEHDAVEKGVVSPDDEDAIRTEEEASYEKGRALVEKAETQVENQGGGQAGIVQQTIESIMSTLGVEGARSWGETNTDNANIAQLEELKSATDRVANHLAHGIRVTNMPTNGLPGAPAGATTGGPRK